MDPNVDTPRNPAFPQTSWSLIYECKDPDAPAFHESLDRLFRHYWQPIYYYIYRNWTRDVESAKDLTQSFFLAFIEKDVLKAVEADKGRFRNYVLVVLRHFLSKEKRKGKAKKRHPSKGILSIDQLKEHNSRFDVPASRKESADAQFDLDWKTTVMVHVLEALRKMGDELGKRAFVDVFERLDLQSHTGRKPTYQELAEELGVTFHQLNNGLHWARSEFKTLFKAELAEQVLTEDDMRTEAWELFRLEL